MRKFIGKYLLSEEEHLVQPSPYTPGETAREIPGRETQFTDITGLLGRVALEGRFAGRVRVDVGPRGVGKTSLLRRAQRI